MLVDGQGREARLHRGQPCQQAIEHRQRDRRAIEQTLLQRRRPPQARREPGLQGVPLRLHRVARRLRACARFAQLAPRGSRCAARCRCAAAALRVRRQRSASRPGRRGRCRRRRRRPVSAPVPACRRPRLPRRGRSVSAGRRCSISSWRSKASTARASQGASSGADCATWAMNQRSIAAACAWLGGHHVGRQPEVERIDCGAAFAGRGDAHQADELAPAAVRWRTTLQAAEPGAQRAQRGQSVVAKGHGIAGGEDGGAFVRRQWGRRRGGRSAGQRQQGSEGRVADACHRHTDQEAVVERYQRFVARHLVAGADDADQRHRQAHAAVVELAFVEQRQQRVQDRRVGLEHLVEEGDARGGQVAVGQALVAVVLERLQRQRPEQFFGRRKARQQALEVARVDEGPVQAPRQFALGAARRPDQQHVLAGQCGQQR